MAKNRAILAWVWLLFFVSGFTGLVYEVLWTRSLTLVFGNTIYAAATVLAAYMGGLALGAWFIGRRVDRVSRPLLLYALLEALVGASALVFPYFLKGSVPLLQVLYRSGHTDALGLVRFLLAFVFLLIPTAAMGGTLPALAKLMARVENAGRVLAWLYGINTFGAVLGTVAAGFYLLPGFGLSGTRWGAVGLNALVALAALGLGAGMKIAVEAPRQKPERAKMGRAEKIALAAFLISGGLALALEVLWTRSLLLVFGSTVYSFSTMLAVFLLGLALGSALMGLFVEKLPRPLWVLGVLEGGVGLLTLAAVAKVNLLPSDFLDGLIRHGLQWNTYLLYKFLIAGGVLLPVALLFGATFPLVARLEVVREGEVGSRVGILYMFNTLGAIAGSLIAGFVMLPLLGLQRSLNLVALIALGLGVFLILTRVAGDLLWPRIAEACLLVLLGFGLFISTPVWNKKILSAGVYFRPHSYISENGKRNILDQVLGQLTLVRFEEGMTETAAVVDTPVSRMFLVDGKVEAATDLVDMRLQRLMGELPPMFARRLDKAVNIGLGCGITLGGLKVYPFKHFECVELEPKVVQTARFFAKQNDDVLNDPRLKIIINDGRNHLLLTNEKYDVITSDPFEPLVGGAASLYTYNHFEIGKQHLRPGGIFCQYLPMYQLSPSDYQMIIRSFCRAYPHVTLWYTGIDTIMLGSTSPQTLTLQDLEGRMDRKQVKASLAKIGIKTPSQLLQTFVMNPRKVPGLVSEGPLNTDQHPYIEFSAPKSHLRNTTLENLKWLIAHYRPQDVPLDLATQEARQVEEKARQVGLLVMKANMERFSGKYPEALKDYRQARDLDPTNMDVLFGLTAADNLGASQLIQSGDFKTAKILLDEALSTGQQPLDTFSTLATWAFKSGHPEMAETYLQSALHLNPKVPDLNLKMALALESLGRFQEAMGWCEKALKLNPRLTEAKLVKADLLVRTGKRNEALKLYEKVLSAKPEAASGGDWLVVGLLHAQSGHLSRAEEAFEKAARLSPQNPQAWYNLARVRMLLRNRSGALDALERARAIAPGTVEGWLAADPILKPLGETKQQRRAIQNP